MIKLCHLFLKNLQNVSFGNCPPVLKVTNCEMSPLWRIYHRWEMYPFFSIVSGSYEYVDTLFGKTEDKSSTWINTRLWKNLYYDLGKGVYINTPLNLMKLREHSLCSKSLVFKFIKQVLMRIPCVSFSYFRKYPQVLQCVRKYFILFYFTLYEFPGYSYSFSKVFKTERSF